jgi:outer membrane protein OmpA-like peptidoglycan-associated protein
MSRGDLQEMEQSKTAVNANAKPAESMPKLTDPGTQLGSVEDLGGPTPENYKPDDDSAKLREPKIATVKDVVNRGAKAADPMKKMAKEEAETSEEVVAEDQTTEEEVVSEEETTEEYNVEEDVNALLGGEELSEEFREKAKVIFEAALNSKVKEIQEALEAQYAEKLAEEKEGLKDTLTERVDAYLEYVCEEWMKENELAVEAGLKTEMTESFLEGMKGLFEEHYVTIPEDKYDVLESMVEKLDEMETKLNEQIDKNIDLNKRLAESTADSILDQISEGLATTQKEKLASLAESVEFESEDEYREKLETLKESYFSSKAPAPKVAQQQTLSEGVDTTEAPVSGTMDAYLRSLGAFKK